MADSRGGVPRNMQQQSTAPAPRQAELDEALARIAALEDQLATAVERLDAVEGA